MPEFAELVQRAIAQYNPTQVIGFEGKEGKLTMQELSVRHGIAMQTSDIIDKSAYQRFFAGDIMTNMIFVNRDKSSVLLEEWERLIKDTEGNEIEGPPNYAANAALAVYKKIYSAFLKSSQPKETEEARMIRHIIEKSRADEEEEKNWF